MKALIQRVRRASVSVDGVITGQIGHGLLVFLGACDADDAAAADKLLKKLVNLRIFADEAGKTNLSVQDVAGEILLISQFTLYANCKKGNRPSFLDAGSPEHAQQLYLYALDRLNNQYRIHTEAGVFGAHMDVSLLNDGPFTIMLDTAEL
ncbi:MAG: D-tyrosyl-tRNA(Tyr) deacylase [Lachnospiraceae bacterium]|nr:D-tyrosyl-tRNA(Tyr) deacylase [Lachnospiraceae bacterium]